METVFGAFAISISVAVLISCLVGYIFEDICLWVSANKKGGDDMEQSKLNWTPFFVILVYSLLFLLLSMWGVSCHKSNKLFYIASGVGGLVIVGYIILTGMAEIWNLIFLIFKKELKSVSTALIAMMIIAVLIFLGTYGVVFEKGWIWCHQVITGMLVILGIGNLFLYKPGEKPYIHKLVKKIRILFMKRKGNFEVVEKNDQDNCAYHCFGAKEKIYLAVLELSGYYFSRKELDEQLTNLESKYRGNQERLRMNQDAYCYLCRLM